MIAFRRYSIKARTSLLSAGTVLVACSYAGQAKAQDVARIVSGVVNSAVQAAVEDARERVFRMRMGNGRPLGFAPESEFDAAFAALGYAPNARNPLYTKAPPKAEPPPQGIQPAIWGSGTYDAEHQTGSFNNGPRVLDLGSDTRSWTGLGGVDFTIPLFGGATFLLGFLGGDTDSRATTPATVGTTTHAETPTAGVYAAYILGDFSADASYTTSWIRSHATTAVAGAAATNMTTSALTDNVAGNLQYRFNFTNFWWLEPTAGVSYTYTIEPFNMPHQEITRVQGGARAGTSFKWGDVTVEPIFTGLAYSDVEVRGALQPGALGGGPLPAANTPTPSDKGQLWGKGVAKFNFVWTQYFSTYVQGEVHGTHGTENITGYVATLGGRLVF